jgi:hypothetical protein
MIAKAVLVSYILQVAQLVAAYCEKDRLAALKRDAEIYTKISDVPAEAWQPKPGQPLAIVVSSMPKPSQAWAEAWAAAVIDAPMFAGNEKYEIAFGLVWAEKESNYNDNAVGDGGKSFCSFQVSTYWGHSGDALMKSPSLCIYTARGMMRQSFKINPMHPMSAYAGSPTHPKAIAISDARNQLVKQVALVLPDIK